MKTILALSLTLITAGVPFLASVGHAETQPPAAATAKAEVTAVTIYRPLGCGCCDAYADYLREHGFDVSIVDDNDFDQRSIAAGVPEQGIGCHLAMIDGYAVSGLVPVEIIERLLEERPEITGITLPGMPGNAPGMAAEKSGTLKIYAFSPEGVSVYSNE